jgi:cellulose synthase/poly-beta-1,6-N-acetylglucosamine synthase-like glycosyltransferase
VELIVAISIVIPATPWDELLWRLELLLEGLTEQTLPATEIVVVDSVGQGEDPVAEVVAKFAGRLPVRSFQMPPAKHESVFRAGEARNYGVARLTKPVPRYLFLDADCVPEPGLLALHDRFGNRPVSVACSRVHIDPRDLPERTLAALWAAPPCRQDSRVNQPSTYSTQFCAWSCVLSVSAKLFHKVGGFWNRMVIEEDIDLGLRMLRAGGRIRYFNRPGVFHIDHPYWRPLKAGENGPGDVLPPWAFTYEQAAELPGYLREPY